ncbi:MAG: phosphoribosylformylglycinamidine synthase subunit PurS [Rhodothermia bacterium]|nr:phosphoribosylformylglycinamidine synthase subunit PurS [Rhodothermia bacterium]
MFKANVEVTLRPSILDPQGKAVQHALHDLGFAAVGKVRIGKHIELWIEAETETEARSLVDAACEKLLTNPVMEDYEYDIERVEEPTAVD